VAIIDHFPSHLGALFPGGDVKSPALSGRGPGSRYVQPADFTVPTDVSQLLESVNLGIQNVIFMTDADILKFSDALEPDPAKYIRLITKLSIIKSHSSTAHPSRSSVPVTSADQTDRLAAPIKLPLSKSVESSHSNDSDVSIFGL
jgi:hypothetical protein